MVDGGARFGHASTLVQFCCHLCWYLSAWIALGTDQDLAQICSEEYDKVTSIFLGIQAEVLGTAHGLNVVFGIDLFSCVFLTATSAIFFQLLASLFDKGSSKLLCIGWASFVLLSYVFRVVIT
ncbi:hypothetical protein EJD97_005617 [Solanum chilense]|uniref:Uncharacterized protein n=1 Tax=Solanum chilense TaxID=4083 RepID=A0A6N2ALI7_SOLCI|nr:hypothetical protein EJD97_005617 [Solanum chilense]